MRILVDVPEDELLSRRPEFAVYYRAAEV